MTIVVIDLNKSRFESGYWNGFRQPAFIFDIRITKNTIQQSTLDQYDCIVEALLPRREPCDHPQIVAKHPLLTRLSSTSMDILSAAGMPTMSGVNALLIRRPDGIHYLLGLCAVSAEVLAPQLAMRWSVLLLRSLEEGREIVLESLRENLRSLIEACKRQAPSGVNTLRFLQAADEEDIPWRHVANNVYQFGWGSRARWLDSSFTDRTPRISVALARDKQSCAAVLRAAGLPAPRHRLVGSEAKAVEAARAFGYPVVVKPANLDGGRGVFVGLRDEAAVQMAYTAARALSQRVLVEQYVAGQDYRLQVHDGEVFSVIHRRPAYVVGDGVATVEALIQRTNHEREQPRADPLAEQARKAITVDEEVHDWLQYQGLTLTTVPASGQWVRLRGAANVSVGGSREEVLHKAHPDNLALAVRVARVMRLDLAGIDLLIPDIARSWKETGATICEVNAQPQISRHLLRPLLSRLVHGSGRIPVIAIAGGTLPVGSVREALVSSLLIDHVNLGWVGAEDSSSVAASGQSADCRALLADPLIDVLVWHIPAELTLVDGLPFDRLDLLIWLEPAIDPATSVQSSAGWQERLRGMSLQVWRLCNPATPTHDSVTLQALPGRLAQFIKARLNTPIKSESISLPE